MVMKARTENRVCRRERAAIEGGLEERWRTRLIATTVWSGRDSSTAATAHAVRRWKTGKVSDNNYQEEDECADGRQKLMTEQTGGEKGERSITERSGVEGRDEVCLAPSCDSQAPGQYSVIETHLDTEHRRGGQGAATAHHELCARGTKELRQAEV